MRPQLPPPFGVSMKPALSFEIPLGHVAHWKQTGNGFEVEFLRFLKPHEAKLRRERPYQRKNAA